LKLFFYFKNEKTRQEIEELVKHNSINELKERLLERMSFGTAGLRSKMGAGYSMMNDLTIIQTAQVRLKELPNTSI
jgi:phosphomannomutase